MVALAVEVLEARSEEDDKDADVATVSLLLLAEGDGDERVELVREDVELDPPNGGGTAALASTSLPTPHGIASPEGCFALAGGVEEPSADSMVKRVVHVLLAV